MTILIPLTASHNNDFELRYCLRSIQMHLSGWSAIVIVGEKPDWITNIQHVKATDQPGGRYKEQNIMRKICAGIPHAGKSFLFMNDDHFLLQDVDAATFPLHHKGPLKDSIKQHGRSNSYHHTLRNTQRLLGDVMNYDTHCPIVYEAEGFKRLPEKFPPYGYGIKTLYCSKNNLRGDYYPDMKVSRDKIAEQIRAATNGRLYFSTGIMSEGMETFLAERYPEKSMFEM